ncbi:hypothetical protein L7F22_021184 [Adiantum nelumboides]|nr:hypothetical protein [Adiantum nelumboides]
MRLNLIKAATTLAKEYLLDNGTFFATLRGEDLSNVVDVCGEASFALRHVLYLDICGEFWRFHDNSDLEIIDVLVIAIFNFVPRPRGGRPRYDRHAKEMIVADDESKQTLCLDKNVGINHTGNLHCPGSQPASILDTAAHVRATIGTQWTPASAAAAAALLHPEAPERTCANLVKGLDLKNEELNREKKASLIQETPKQENNVRINDLQKRPSRLQRFEQFQLLDLINDSRDSAQCKKDARSENYAAYVLEGMGNVANHTPIIEKVGQKKSRYNKAIPACNSKHGIQKSPQAFKERSKGRKCKMQLQRHYVSLTDDDSEAVTHLESFSDSNGEHFLGECKMRTSDSFKNQSTRKLDFWDRSHSVDSNEDQLSSWTLFNEQGLLGSDFAMGSYQDPFESPKSVGFAPDEDMFPLCLNYGTFDTNNGMDDQMLSDNTLRNFHSCLSSDDVTQSLQLGCFADDKLQMIDSSSPTSSPQPLLEKTPQEFSFNSPGAELFSESTFEFQVTILDSSIPEKDLESPALWERKLDATHKHSGMVTFEDMSPAHSVDDIEFDFLNSSKHDNTEICAVGSLRAVETESSSVDTFFGTSILDVPSSPTSPLFKQSHPSKLIFGRNLK